MMWGPFLTAAGWAASVVGSALLAPAAVQRGDGLNLAIIPLGLIPLVCAAITSYRRPARVEGPLFATAGAALILAFLLPPLTNGPFEGAWMFLYAPVATLLLVAPTGRTHTRAGALLARAVWAVVIAFNALVAGAWALRLDVPALRGLGAALVVAYFVLLALSAASVIRRHHRSGARERAGLRWVLLAGVTVPFTLTMCWASYLFLGGPDLVVVGFLAMFAAVPVSVMVAVFRPEGFDFDRAVATAVSATLLALAVLGTLTVGAVVAGRPLLTWSPASAVVLAAAGAASAVSVFPALRGWVSRMLYPARARAASALRELGRQIDDGRAVPEQVQQVLGAALKDEGLRVCYSISGRAGEFFDVTGQEVDLNRSALTFSSRGRELGAVVPGREPLRRPASDLVPMLIPIVEAVRARGELQLLLADLHASRERIVLATYAERRRLERDLHDGVQQRLVALGIRLRLLERSLGQGSELAAGLDEAVAELSAAVAELRQIANGVRPSALDAGLRSALAELCQRSHPAPELYLDIDELPDPVAVTAYYVVSEALTNSLRHARAERIWVEVQHENPRLRVLVHDNGRGGAKITPLGGLAGLTDRVAAFGGLLTIASTTEGTTVEAVLPCAS